MNAPAASESREIPRSERPALVVSVHDVSPLTRAVVGPMIEELRSLGVERTSLLVIADHHHRGHMLSDAGFCRWLEGLAGEGHEVVVHGYYHQRTARPRETWRERWITRVYTMGEGEFFDLRRDEATALLGRAREDFRRLDVPEPTGFIAPAWLLGEEAGQAVREMGFRYTTSIDAVEEYTPAGSRRDVSRSLVYSCRNRWRRAASLLWNGTLERGLRGNRLLRLGLHPPDYRHPAIWRQVRGVVQGAVRLREATTYGEFVRSHPRRRTDVSQGVGQS